MSEYIHSGVAGKMNRIVKPHIGKVLVTDKFGNAKESDVTIENLRTELEEDAKIGNLNNLNTTNKTNLVSAINEIQAGLGSSGSDWEWNPTPIYEETLTNGFYYDDEDGSPYAIPSSLFTVPLKAILVCIFGGTLASALNHTCTISFNKNISLPGDVNVSQGLTVDVALPIKTTSITDTTYSLTLEAFPIHNQYFIIGSRNKSLLRSSYETVPDAPPPTLYLLPPINSLGITGCAVYSSIPAGAKVTVYAPLNA